jgi:hypothetical protein
VRDGDLSLDAAGESGKLQCDEGSEEEFTEVHKSTPFSSYESAAMPARLYGYRRWIGCGGSDGA